MGKEFILTFVSWQIWLQSEISFTLRICGYCFV